MSLRTPASAPLSSAASAPLLRPTRARPKRVTHFEGGTLFLNAQDAEAVDEERQRRRNAAYVVAEARMRSLLEVPDPTIARSARAAARRAACPYAVADEPDDEANSSAHVGGLELDNSSAHVGGLEADAEPAAPEAPAPAAPVLTGLLIGANDVPAVRRKKRVEPQPGFFSAGAGALLDERRVGDNPLLWADPTPPPRPSRRRAARPAWMPEVAPEPASPVGDGDGAVEDDDDAAATTPPRRRPVYLPPRARHSSFFASPPRRPSTADPAAGRPEALFGSGVDAAHHRYEATPPKQRAYAWGEGGGFEGGGFGGGGGEARSRRIMALQATCGVYGY